MMEILIIFFLILLNGIFSMSEIALVSSRKFKLESAARKGNSGAAKALALSKTPNTFLSTVQIGITLIGILTGIFGGEELTANLKTSIEKIPLLQPYAQSLAVFIIVLAITFFSIVFGELIPKRIGLMFPESIAAAVARPMTIISIIAKPFIWLLTKTNDLFLSIFGLRDKKEGAVSEEEIKAIVQESAQGGEIQAIEQDIVQRVFALGDRKISELMTHRKDLVVFDITDNLTAVKQKALEEAHSVYPVFDKSPDNFIGIVSVKDIFPQSLTDTGFTLQAFLKQPLKVPLNMPAYKVLEKFRIHKMHYAFVTNEYGTVEGMVSMDDLLDALIGDVTEYNQQEYEVIKRGDNSWLVDGGYPFFEFLQYFGLQAEDTGYPFNTLAGLLLSHLRRIPTAGEKLTWKDFVLEVVDMDGPKIDKIMVTRKL